MVNMALVIMASGKSTRFGGFPKAFCEINGLPNVQRTINLAKNNFEKIYLVVNKETCIDLIDKIKGCEIIQIVTGKGDAHSLLKALKIVREREMRDLGIVVCWGDAVFVDALPLEELMKEAVKMSDEEYGIAACCYDRDPYAWFDVHNRFIVKSHFRNYEKSVKTGLHDQSLFYFHLNKLIELLERYRESLGIKDDEDCVADEMKLLCAIEYFYSILCPVSYRVIHPQKVYSFNTKDELENLIRKIG